MADTEKIEGETGTSELKPKETEGACVGGTGQDIPVSYQDTVWAYMKPLNHDNDYLKFVQNERGLVELTMAPYVFDEYMNYRMRLYRFETVDVISSSNVFRSDVIIEGRRYYLKVIENDIILEPSNAEDENIKQTTNADSRFFFHGSVGDKTKLHFNPVANADVWLQPNAEDTGLKIGPDDTVFEVYPQVVIRDIITAYIMTIGGLVLTVHLGKIVARHGEPTPKDKFMVYIFTYDTGTENKTAVIFFHIETSSIFKAVLGSNNVTVTGLELEYINSHKKLQDVVFADPRLFLMEKTGEGDMFISHEDYSVSITVLIETDLVDNYSVSLLHDMKGIKPDSGVTYENRFKLEKLSDTSNLTDEEKESNTDSPKGTKEDKSDRAPRRSFLQRICPCLQ